MKHEKISSHHLERKAILYVRQSSAHQVLHNRESGALQYAMRDRLATLGWSCIETIDDDLGRSAAGGVTRAGFDRMVAEVCLGRVGAVAAREVSRFARNSRDWQQLIEMCRVVDTVLIDQETVYAPRQGNDRLLLGLKGSGSNTVVFEQGQIPAHWGLENKLMVDVDVSEGTPGLRLHDNPMYGGRAISCFTLSLAAVMVGAAYNALDEYETMMTTKSTPLPPFVPRKHDADYQRYYGGALAKIATAEAAMMNAADQHMELCQRFVDSGTPYSYADDHRIGCIGREVMIQAWEIVQADICRTAGSSAAAAGQRLDRIFRDMSIGNSHRNTQLRDWAFREIARDALGLPREYAEGNVQAPRT
jgi:hypothetical protein